MALQYIILGWEHDKITKRTWKMKWKTQTHSAFGNFSNLKKIPGITTLFLKLAEDDNLTGLQTITKLTERSTSHKSPTCILYLKNFWNSLRRTSHFSHVVHALSYVTVLSLSSSQLSSPVKFYSICTYFDSLLKGGICTSPPPVAFVPCAKQQNKYVQN